MSGPSELTLFVGRLHPLLVHLPIGLIVLLAALELLARVPRFRHANASAGFILALAIPAAVFTVLVGWLLSWAGGYEARLLQWHKWTGLATAAACTLAGLLYGLDRKRPYRWCLFSSFLVLVVASHFGGSLTHGRDYLVRYAPQPWRHPGRAANPTRTAASKAPLLNDLPTFTAVVQPVLQQNCVACHGPQKAKGRLRVDSLAALFQGGEAGPAVVPGKAAESPLLQRVLLPLSSDNHMPPEGKPQPSPEDIALLKWWIETGASSNKAGAMMVE
ncbi:MAG TPA: c-type cytochrome domain-containing protein [Candidatus Sulfotelmatobacter sp.]|nr:c-type cytochrome domain-containing protein [Candidatus Sulfotelmatobacter sp.]HWI59284.1 c-type cytochrome domain-containing protein [Bacillota bacterium]